MQMTKRKWTVVILSVFALSACIGWYFGTGGFHVSPQKKGLTELMGSFDQLDTSTMTSDELNQWYDDLSEAVDALQKSPQALSDPNGTFELEVAAGGRINNISEYQKARRKTYDTGVFLVQWPDVLVMVDGRTSGASVKLIEKTLPTYELEPDTPIGFTVTLQDDPQKAVCGWTGTLGKLQSEMGGLNGPSLAMVDSLDVGTYDSRLTVFLGESGSLGTVDIAMKTVIR